VPAPVVWDVTRRIRSETAGALKPHRVLGHRRSSASVTVIQAESDRRVPQRVEPCSLRQGAGVSVALLLVVRSEHLAAERTRARFMADCGRARFQRATLLGEIECGPPTVLRCRFATGRNKLPQVGERPTIRAVWSPWCGTGWASSRRRREHAIRSLLVLDDEWRLPREMSGGQVWAALPTIVPSSHACSPRRCR
jgi:hypothetical protein